MSSLHLSLYGAVLTLLLVAACCCFRVSSWHQQESDFWYRIHALWLIDPKGTDARYLPVLVWKCAHPERLPERIRGWRDPVARMDRANSGRRK